MATKKQNDEQAAPTTPVEEKQAGTENSGQEGAHGEAKASEVRKAAPVSQEYVAAAPQTAINPRKTADRDSLMDLAVLADRHRVPSWQQAALLRLMGWMDGKRVSDADYRAALESLRTRRIGGGRR